MKYETKNKLVMGGGLFAVWNLFAIILAGPIFQSIFFAKIFLVGIVFGMATMLTTMFLDMGGFLDD